MTRTSCKVGPAALISSRVDPIGVFSPSEKPLLPLFSPGFGRFFNVFLGVKSFQRFPLSAGPDVEDISCRLNFTNIMGAVCFSSTTCNIWYFWYFYHTHFLFGFSSPIDLLCPKLPRRCVGQSIELSGGFLCYRARHGDATAPQKYSTRAFLTYRETAGRV